MIVHCFPRGSSGAVVVIACAECGAELVTATNKPGRHVTLEHEAECDFYQAVERGAGEAWAIVRGYPIHVTVYPTDGAA